MNFLEPGSMHVKICGITSAEDAIMAASAGADALGFNFYQKSSRYIDPVESIPWIRDLGDNVDRVAVVVNPSEDLLEKLLESGCFEIIQFHGDEPPAFCDWAGFARWIKAIRVSDSSVLEQAMTFDTPYILLDGWTAGAYGGTGQRLDWDLVRDFVIAHGEKRFILAGGLNVQNVRQAIRIVRPHAVDVASGVELNPRKKEEYLVREFIRVAKNLPA